MRDNTYMIAFLIATCCMLIGGLAVTGLEIYQYTRGNSPAVQSQAAPSNQQKPGKQKNTVVPDQKPEDDKPEDPEE